MELSRWQSEAKLLMLPFEIQVGKMKLPAQFNLLMITMLLLSSCRTVRKTHSDHPVWCQAGEPWAYSGKVCSKRSTVRADWGTSLVCTFSELGSVNKQTIKWSATVRRSVLLLIALQSFSAWKAAKSHLPAFLYPFPTHVFSLSPPGHLSYPQRKPVWSCRVLLFQLSGFQTSSEHSKLFSLCLAKQGNWRSLYFHRNPRITPPFSF